MHLKYSLFVTTVLQYWSSLSVGHLYNTPFPNPNPSSLHLVGQVYLPRGYDKTISPPPSQEDFEEWKHFYGNRVQNVGDSHVEEGSVLCNLSLVIRKVYEINENEGTLKLEMMETMTWRETRLEFNESFMSVKAAITFGDFPNDAFIHLHIPLKAKLDHLWTPELVFEEAVSMSYTKEANIIAAETIWPYKVVTVQKRYILELNCDFNLVYYPADTQHCVFHTNVPARGNVILDWITQYHHFVTFYPDSDNTIPVQLKYRADNNYNYWVGVDFHRCESKLCGLDFMLSIQRRITYHLLQTYFLTVFFVVATWFCFIISSDMMDIRIGIGMGALLSLTTMFNSSKEVNPRTSYIKAIDVWMVANIIFVFLALSEFVFVAWAKKTIKIFIQEGDINDTTIESLVRFGKTPHPEYTHVLINNYKKWAANMEKCALVLLPLLYLIFNIIYWTWLITSSAYF